MVKEVIFSCDVLYEDVSSSVTGEITKDVVFYHSDDDIYRLHKIIYREIIK